MALTIEDGTGVADADSYVSVADLRTWATKRGFTVSADDGVVGGNLIAASDYADSYPCHRLKGTRLTDVQNREMPRSGLLDWSQKPVVGIPRQWKDAVCYLAVQAESGPLFVAEDRGGKIISETVGPISTTYDKDAPAGRVFTQAEQLLQQYWRSQKDALPQLGYEAPDSGTIFSMNMMDNPEPDDC